MRRHGDYGSPNVKRVPPKGLSGYQVIKFNGWTEVLLVPELGPCWEYNGPKFANGYGQIKVDGIPKLAHRFVYQHKVGEIPNGHVIRHKCDNKPCINPSHLLTGTSADNSRDAVERGRMARGLNNINGKFSEEEIVEIRIYLGKFANRAERGVRMRELANKHSCNASTIQKIWLRTTYKYLPYGYMWNE